MGGRIVGQAIVCAAAIAQGEVQEPIRAKGDITSVVVELGFVDGEENDLRARVGLVGVAGRGRILGQDFGVAAARGPEAWLAWIAGLMAPT